MNALTRTPMPQTPGEVVYPDQDGQPMSDDTLQFEWIVTIKEGLESLFRDRPDGFVAGDLLWYPVEGDPATRTAPDAMVAFGRPKGYRGSYQQWKEEGVAPQVVFEVVSPGNRPREMVRKFRFYDRFGIEEFYLYDPNNEEISGWVRQDGELQEIPEMNGWTSPRLGVRFDMTSGSLRLVGPDGRLFATYVELARQRDDAERRAEAERQRAERLAERLRQAGIDPEDTS